MSEFTSISLPRSPELVRLVAALEDVCADQETALVLQALLVLFLSGVSGCLTPEKQARLNEMPLAHVVLALFDMDLSAIERIH
jgi:hypothetical protein